MSSQEESPRFLKLLRRYTLPSLAAAGTAGLLELLRARFQHNQVFAPTRYPEGDWDPARHGLPYRDEWFESEPGVRLHGWWIRHPAARAAVLYCHGNAGSLGDRIEIFRQLRRLKVDVFAFDYRGFGRSADASPSEKGLFRDVRAAYGHLTGNLGVDRRRVILFGHSLGGAVAIDAALDSPVAGLVVQSSFTDLRDMARHVFHSVPMYLVTRNQFRSIAKVGRLTMPKLFIHGTLDVKVPFAMGERLYAAAARPKAWLPVPGAEHNDLHQHGPMRYFRALARFRQRCVGS